MYNFTYDTRGNVTNNKLRKFNFNRANQLDCSALAHQNACATGTNRYIYDGFNRRVKTTDATGISYSMYSQDGTLLFKQKDDFDTNYIYLGKKLVARSEDAFAPQTAGSSRQHNLPFGETVETPKNDVGYTGHQFDTDLGLSYMQQRYYDPAVGVFYSPDPVGYTADNPVMSFNRYLYVNNNPYKYTDPNGEFFMFAAPFLAGLFQGSVATTSVAAGLAAAEVTVAVTAITVVAVAGSEAINSYNESTGGTVKDKKRKFTKGDREKMKEAAGGECEYCGEELTMEPGSGNSMEGDHIDPWIDGGQTNEENGAASCRTCNRSKGRKKLGDGKGQFSPKGPNDRIRDKVGNK